jgi:hypothetical protein
LQQRRNKEICKLPYLEDFEANVEVAEDKISCQLKHTREEHNVSHSPSQSFVHTDLHDTAIVWFQKCYLPVKVIFLSDHFYSVVGSIACFRMFKPVLMKVFFSILSE